MQHTEKLGEKMNLEKDAKKTIEVTISSFHKDEGKEIAEILIESFDSFVKSFFQEVLPCTQK